MNRPIFVFIAIITYGILLGGCGQKELGDEPTKYASQDGLEQLTKQAAQGANTATQSGASNPKFKSSSDKQPTSEAVKNLDAAIRPVLVQQFGAAKLIEEEDAKRS
jgi:hypothetical protein